ncbi:sensor histidine kinase [Streptomyces umbrinus]|uniref:sensor histidine kinase n=1 Tax=Streptomyces umbrinus TaxID=67370 RepID=UPI0033E6B1EB
MRLTSRLPRLPIRVRLTLLYGALFMACGVILLGVTYLLLDAGLTDRFDGVALQITKEGGIAPVPEASAHNLPSEPAAGLAGSPELRELQDRYRAATLQSLLRQGALALGVLTVVATLFGYLMAGRVLRPLNRISQTARRITSRGDLSERLAFTGPRDEVTELADTFDSMMGRLEKSFQDQQRFIADASHELRTPLAINRTLVEVALRRKTATEDTKRLGTSLLAVNERNERLINGLLALAKGETEVANRTPVDLTELARHTAELHQSQAAEAGIGLRLDTRPATTSGNAVMLERIIHNLLENAIRYNEPNGWVRLTTRTTPHGAATLTVENTGPVVACQDIEALFQPFRRLGADRIDSERGSGLGLAIVRAIARSHDGDVTAAPRERGGLMVTTTLPR